MTNAIQILTFPEYMALNNAPVFVCEMDTTFGKLTVTSTEGYNEIQDPSFVDDGNSYPERVFSFAGLTYTARFASLRNSDKTLINRTADSSELACALAMETANSMQETA
jgi:hypothetical protein